MKTFGKTVAIVSFLAALPAAAQSVEPADGTPRIAVMSAFAPEWVALQEGLSDREDHVVNGTTYATGVLEGKPVVLFLTGVSMVNAAMTTQIALDRFDIETIVFSGIAGGVDPAEAIVDVIPWVLPLAGALLIFLLAFIAVTMA